MTVLATAVLSFAAGFLIHVIWWRMRIPRATAASLFLVFACANLAGILMWALIAIGGSELQVIFGELLALCICDFAIMAAYINTYPAIEAKSPTLHMLEIMSKAGETGLSYPAIEEALGGEKLVLAQIESLVADGFAIREGKKMFLTNHGSFLANVFWFYRRLSGRATGG